MVLGYVFIINLNLHMKFICNSRIFITIFVILVFGSPLHADNQIILSDKIQPLEAENVFHDEEYFNWCSSIIKGDDGKYHMFYSRWEKSKSFRAWLTHSTIAHAVSDKPYGPYKYVETVLDFERETYKKDDMITAHNPKIKYFDGKYYLYFISTKMGIDITNDELLNTAKTGLKHMNWNILRKNQRTFVAVSNSLNGGWKVNKTSLIEPSGPITTLAVNPAITLGPDNRYYMIIKGDKPGTTKFERNQAIAISDRPDSGFKLQSKPVINDWDTEDVSMWYDKFSSRFYAVFHAHKYIGMMTSKDGINWEKASDFEIMKKRIEFVQPDSVVLPKRLERPFVYIENDIPRVLSLAVFDKNDSYIITVPLKDKDFSDNWEYVGIAIDEPGYHVWGSSPIWGEDGKVHLFASRWGIEHKFNPGWRSHSEIAHYVSDKPEGPFKFSDVVLAGSGKKTWDKFGIHNPAIHKVGDKYILLYISNDNYQRPYHPSNQKIGMMMSDNLYGPWKKVGKDGCILKPSTDPKHWTYKSSNGVNNPALFQNNGKFFLYFKSNKSQMGLAIADKIEGPYVMLENSVTKNSKGIEDGYAFEFDGKICLLTTDNHGILEKGGGILWKSEDGQNFNEYESGFHKIDRYISVEKVSKVTLLYGPSAKFERPQILMKDGSPAYLYVPSGANINGDNHTIVYVLRFKGDKKLSD